MLSVFTLIVAVETFIYLLPLPYYGMRALGIRPIGYFSVKSILDPECM